MYAYDGQAWTQINESGFGDANNLAVMAGLFEDKLYAGTYNLVTGGQLWMLDGSDWIQVNTRADFNSHSPVLRPSRLMDQLALYTMSNAGIGIWVHAPPIVEAGADQTAFGGASVSLDGSSSTTGSGDTCAWTQISGTTVTLSGAASISPTFTAPQVATGEENLVFELTITDNGGYLDSDQVTITVANQCTLTTAEQDSGTIRLDPEGGTYAEGTQNPLSVTLNNDMSITAVFVAPIGDSDSGGGDSSNGSSGGGGGGGCFIDALSTVSLR